MRLSIKSLTGYTVHGTDGELGEVTEFYFDDQTWKIRYMIVKMGSWLFGRKVLISPQALEMPDWENGAFHVSLSREQIRNSPDIDTDKPVSRQHEEKLFTHYSWDGYWDDGYYEGTVFGVVPDVADLHAPFSETTDVQPPAVTHLRSTHRITGYRIHATDGEMGKVTDFVMDNADWKIFFLVVRTGHWMQIKDILMSTKWVKEIQWSTSDIMVDISSEKVKSGPTYNETDYIDEAYEKSLFDHYGKPLEDHKTEFSFK